MRRPKRFQRQSPRPRRAGWTTIEVVLAVALLLGAAAALLSLMGPLVERGGAQGRDQARLAWVSAWGDVPPAGWSLPALEGGATLWHLPGIVAAGDTTAPWQGGLPDASGPWPQWLARVQAAPAPVGLATVQLTTVASAAEAAAWAESGWRREPTFALWLGARPPPTAPAATVTPDSGGGP